VEVVKCTVHECRHVWQVDTGKQCNNRERDATLFELEFTINLSGKTYDELLRSLTTLKPSLPAQPRQPQQALRIETRRDFLQSKIRESELFLQGLGPRAGVWQTNFLRGVIAELKKEMQST
jgi:hypothetical protein